MRTVLIPLLLFGLPAAACVWFLRTRALYRQGRQELRRTLGISRTAAMILVSLSVLVICAVFVKPDLFRPWLYYSDVLFWLLLVLVFAVLAAPVCWFLRTAKRSQQSDGAGKKRLRPWLIISAVTAIALIAGAAYLWFSNPWVSGRH